MSLKKRIWAILFLLTAVSGLVLLSSGLTRMRIRSEGTMYRFRTAEETAAEQAERDALLEGMPSIPESIIRYLLLAAMLLMPVGILFLLLSPEARRALRRDFILLLPLALLVVAFSSLRGCSGNELSSFSADLTMAPDIPDWVLNPPMVAVFFISILLFTLLSLATWLIWRHSRLSTLDQIAQEAQATLKELRAGRDFRNAIIRCYIQMCQILREQQRIERAQGMTPREFAHRLEQLGLAGEPAQRLTRLFEAVRYGGQTVGAVEEEEAIACLSAVAKAAKRTRRHQAGLPWPPATPAQES